MLVAVTTSLLGYIVFWCYFWSPFAGQYASLATIILGVAGCLLIFLRRHSWQSLLHSDDLRVPLLFMVLAGLFYACLTYSVDMATADELQPRLRFMSYLLPDDNRLPLMFAQDLYRGVDPRASNLEWQSSDRPPLQAGIFLMQRPLDRILPYSTGLHYQFLGCALQCFWIPAVWGALRSFGTSVSRAQAVLALMTFSGFVMINCAFPWPKMLAGALSSFAVVVVLQSDARRALSWSTIVAAAIAAGLAFLAHGVAAFTILLLPLFAIRRPLAANLGRGAVAALVFAAVLLPWIAYQKLYDPPGNQLLKLHLAGEIGINDRSVLQTLLNSYRRWGPAVLLHNRWENLRVLFIPEPKTFYGAPRIDPGGFQFSAAGLQRFCDWWRLGEFHTLSYALGFLNVGWLVLAARAFSGWRDPDTGFDRGLRRLLPFALANILLWIVIMLGPATTVLHHGPYAAFLFLFAVLAGCIDSLPAAWFNFFLTLQVGWFALAWVIESPANSAGRVNYVLLALAGLFAFCLIRMARVPGTGEWEMIDSLPSTRII
jgi:hypothetical protein